MENINDSYFDGYYKDIWRAIISEDLTAKEIDFILQYFNLQPGNNVLDLMCGYGRHAIALAKKGISVTAIDNLGGYVNEIIEISEKEQLPLKVVKGDVTNYNINEVFDLAICMGNSLNFFTGEDIIKLLANISVNLRKGGHFLINTWSLAEIVFKSFKERSWGPVGDFKFLYESRVLFQPARMETESTIIASNGCVEVKTGIDYIFSINEMEWMMNKAGLTLREVYSIPGRKKFSFGELTAYLVAQKN